ncbi:MAG: magnesium transporter, partial [Acidimicrobiaceae bacterium]|nr:magnesium transporter [Acidimicrobiaceae bacterium]
MTEALTRKYRKGVLDSENFPVSEISECLEEPGTLVWVDLCGPSVDQLHELAAE